MRRGENTNKKPGSYLLSHGRAAVPSAYEIKNLAATYSPTDGPQYHRRTGVSLTCSGWERVFQPGHGHQEGSGRSTLCGATPQPVSEERPTIWSSLTAH